jgi:hypothetical protein
MFYCDDEEAVVVIVDSPILFAGLVDDFNYDDMLAGPPGPVFPLTTPLSL